MRGFIREARAFAKLLIAGNHFAPTVLMYHSIGRNAAHFNVTPEAFTAQMDFLATNGFSVLPLQECVKKAAAGEMGKFVALTFDDGYFDFMENALTELIRRKFPATVFLIAAKMGQNYSISDGTTIQIMTWDQARDAQSEGIEFGSHTMTHPKLTGLSPDAVREELAHSKEVIGKELGVAEKFWLCYPHGRNSPELRRIARELGYAGAVTIDAGHPDTNTDVFGVPRAYVHSMMGKKEFEALFI